MTYVMMTISNWEQGQTAPSIEDVSKTFNMAASDIDENFGVIPLGPQQHVVLVTPEGAKKMLATHVDNTVRGKGPFVAGPYSNSPLKPF